MEHHPRWEDLGQLEATKRQLARLGGEAAPAGGTVGGRYSLSPLVLPALSLGRFSAEKARLREMNARWLAEFATRLRAQQERGFGRLRRELEAVAEARGARLRREEEATVFDRARVLRAELAEEIVNLEIDINTLRARIAIVPPPPERETLEAEAKRLEARLEALRARVRSAEALAKQEMEERLRSAAQSEAGEIDRRLARERSEAARTRAALLQKQRAALETTLAALTDSASAGTGRSVAAPYVIAAPFASGAHPDAALGPAVRRVEAEREALRRFIREDTLAVLKDAAAERNLRLTLDPGAGAPDLTTQFIDRIETSRPEP